VCRITRKFGKILRCKNISWLLDRDSAQRHHPLTLLAPIDGHLPHHAANYERKAREIFWGISSRLTPGLRSLWKYCMQLSTDYNILPISDDNTGVHPTTCNRTVQPDSLHYSRIAAFSSSAETTKSQLNTTVAMGSTASTLNITLQNQTSSSTVYAYITGQAINNNNALVLLQADGKSLYYPTSPSTTGTPLSVNCGISLGVPGSKTTVTIPQIAGGRIWFCVGSPLTFLLNPGPGLV
jgi:hypothetical protein